MELEKCLTFRYSEAIEQEEYTGTFTTFEDLTTGSSVSFTFGDISRTGIIRRKKMSWIGMKGSQRAHEYEYEFVVSHPGFSVLVDFAEYFDSIGDLLGKSPITISGSVNISDPIGSVRFSGSGSEFIRKLADWCGKLWYLNPTNGNVVFFDPPSGALTIPDEVLEGSIEEEIEISEGEGGGEGNGGGGGGSGGISGVKLYHPTTISGMASYGVWLERDKLRVVVEGTFEEEGVNYVMFYAEQMEHLPDGTREVFDVRAWGFNGTEGLTDTMSSSVSEWDYEEKAAAVLIKIRKAVEDTGNMRTNVENFLDSVCRDSRIGLGDFIVDYSFAYTVRGSTTYGSEPYFETEERIPPSLVATYFNKIVYKMSLRKRLTYTKAFSRNATLPKLGAGGVTAVTYEYDSVADRIICTVEVSG